MRRRELLSASALALLVPGAAFAAGAHTTEFTAEAYEQAIASGEAFMLDFYAPW